MRGKLPYRELDHPASAPDARVAADWWAYDAERSDSPIRDIFAGQLRSAVACSRCGHVSRAFDTCWELGVPIPKAAQVRARRAGPFASAAAVGGACSLDECVAAFTAPEDLAKQGYRCPGCKAEACVKTTQVWRGPAVLVVVVKRFAYSAFRRAKISVSVELPQALDLRPFCAKGAPALRGRTDYSLWGVVNHSGSLHGGHYTADCRNADTGQWFCFNDSRVSTSRRPTGGASPYLLFYVRNDAAPGVGHRDGGRL